MGWFEDQIKQREERDEQLLEDSFVRAAEVVLGKRDAMRLSDDWIVTNQAIEDVLKFYHFKPADITRNIKNHEQMLDYSFRPHGIMRRNVELSENWYRDSYGIILAYFKEDGAPIALIPKKLFGYYYKDRVTGRNVTINAKTAELFEKEAYCFYKPLPQKKLGISDLLLYMRGCISKSDNIVVLTATFTATVLGLMIPRIIKALTGQIYLRGEASALIGVAICVLCLAISTNILNSIKGLLSQRLQIKTSLSVQAAMMMRILSLPSSFFRDYSAGELTRRSQAVNMLCNLLMGMIFSTGLVSIMSLLYFTQIFSFASFLVVPAFLMVLFSFFITFVSAVVQMKVSRRQMEYEAKASGMSYSMISGVQKLKLAAAEKRAFAKWLNLYSDGARLLYNPPLLLKIHTALELTVTLIATIILYFFAAGNEIDGSSYIAFNAAYGSLMGAFTALGGMAIEAGKIKPMLDMAEPFLKTEPETADDKEMVTKINGGIELSNVYFRYGEDLPYIVNGMSLKIKPGEYIAIVGRTGCGKSTLVRLLLGFEKPERGAIYFDGKDIKKLDLCTLRRKIGSVMQNGSLFMADIYSNIIIAAPELTVEQAWEAAEIAGIADDIRAMPMGMHTMVSEGQGGISGGQKQRLMIARAIAPKPKLLIFDEATSALDNKTQKQVSDALDKMGCTRIVIAHRLSTIKNCDRILVLEGGQIVEDGTYDELIAKNGFFAELVERQRLDTAM